MDGVERTVDIGAITVNPDLQIRFGSEGPSRITLRPGTVEEYQELIAQGVDMGRLAVVDVQEAESAHMLLLADGFHRLDAMRRLGHDQIDVIVYAGTQDDAVLLACELNARRGLSYNVADRRKVAERYLEALFRKGQHLSDSEVARRLGFSRRTIERARADLAMWHDLPPARQVTRGGTTYTMTPRATQRENLEDLEDETANEVIYPETRSALPRPASRPYRPSTSGSRPTPLGGLSNPATPSALSPQSSALVNTVTFAVQWTYVDAHGQIQIGATLHEAMAELPPVVRARVLRDLG